jgi:hypothetical protein
MMVVLTSLGEIAICAMQYDETGENTDSICSTFSQYIRELKIQLLRVARRINLFSTRGT